MFRTSRLANCRGLIALALIFLTAGCTNADVRSLNGAGSVFPSETQAMRKKLHETRARVIHLAELSKKTYLTDGREKNCPGFLTASPNTECFSVAVPKSRKGHRVVYIIETNHEKQEQFIAIRGTNNLADLRKDFQTRRVMDDDLEVKIHSGFQMIAKAIHEDITKNLRLVPTYKTLLTGHSLGGATAILTGLYLLAEGRDVEAIYTYGQPKIFDNTGTTRWPGFFSERVFRVVNCDDPVPILPTQEKKLNSIFRFTTFNKDRLTNYQHMGQSLLLMDGGRFWMPGSIEVERDLSTSVKDAMIGWVKGQSIDHGIEEYIFRIKAIPMDSFKAIPVHPSTEFACSRIAPRPVMALSN